MIITLCSSATFFEKLSGLEQALQEYGHTVLLPSMIDYHGREEDVLAKIHHDLIRVHFDKIAKSDAIYVANYKKHGIPGYIGGNTFLEMGVAFHLQKPIYLLNDLPQTCSYKEELLALKPVVIGTHWHELSTIRNTTPSIPL